MPRQARLDYPGALQHVISRGVGRCRIFDDSRDRKVFLELLAGLLGKSGAKCLAWSLLPNHFHLLLRTGRWPLKTLMQRLLTRYSVHYNHRHRRAGHLFQNRYKSVLCEEDPYLLELVRYIHLNPLRAGEVGTYNDLARHPWCGHGAVLGARKVEWQARDEVLGEFGSRRSEARKAYDEFVKEGVGKGRRGEYSGGGLIRSAGGVEEVLKLARRRERMRGDERILGSGEYVAEVLREVEHRDRRRAGLKERLEPRKVVRRACEVMGVEEKALYGGRRLKAVSAARSLAAKWLVEDLGMTVTAVGSMLQVTAPAVIYAVRKGKEVEEGKRAKLSY
jgi:REP element-mobilizing transposase RayT